MEWVLQILILPAWNVEEAEGSETSLQAWRPQGKGEDEMEGKGEMELIQTQRDSCSVRKAC